LEATSTPTGAINFNLKDAYGKSIRRVDCPLVVRVPVFRHGPSGEILADLGTLFKDDPKTL
jgi:hypothetical protein